MEPLPWFVALGGGVFIGTAAGLLLLLSGRIAGVSGLAATALGISAKREGWPQALTFVVALPVGAFAAAAVVRPPAIEVTSSPLLLLLAGLLVGFGTRLGNGCTSGHGVCGIGRLSVRSLAATATFMAFGLLTVLLARHVLGFGS